MPAARYNNPVDVARSKLRSAARRMVAEESRGNGLHEQIAQNRAYRELDIAAALFARAVAKLAASRKPR